MAQMRFGECLDWRARAPDITAPEFGMYTVDVRPHCKAGWAEQTVKTTHACETGPPLDNVFGLASFDARPKVAINTEIGALTQRAGPVARFGYMPTSAELSTIYSLDTRRTAISDRYYR